jgi:hypothetical protein
MLFDDGSGWCDESFSVVAIAERMRIFHRVESWTVSDEKITGVMLVK